MTTAKIDLHDVSSSAISRVGYDRATETLAVEFRNSGRIFHHAGIGQAIFRELLSADSAGTYYNENIRGSYPTTRMTGPCEQCGDEGWIGDACSDCGTAKHIDAVAAMEGSR